MAGQGSTETGKAELSWEYWNDSDKSLWKCKIVIRECYFDSNFGLELITFSLEMYQIKAVRMGKGRDEP